MELWVTKGSNKFGKENQELCFGLINFEVFIIYSTRQLALSREGFNSDYSLKKRQVHYAVICVFIC